MRTQGGFSLIEMLVAFTIMSAMLVAFYQSAGTSVSNINHAQGYAYATTLAESVLASYPAVPQGGLHERGELENGYRWRIESTARDSLPESHPTELYDITVTVGWGNRELIMHSVMPEEQVRE